MKKILLILVGAVFVALACFYLYLGVSSWNGSGDIIDENHVRGSAIMANGLNYTLSYDQQKGVLGALADAKAVQPTDLPPYSKQPIEALLIYTFTHKEPIEFFPVSDDFAYFKISDSYIQVDDPDALQTILESAYDQ